MQQGIGNLAQRPEFGLGDFVSDVFKKDGDAEVRQTEVLMITSPVVSKQEGFFVGWRLVWD